MSVCVSIVQRSPTGSPVFESVLMRASVIFWVASAFAMASLLVGALNLTVTSVPPVNERPSRSGEPSLYQW